MSLVCLEVGAGYFGEVDAAVARSNEGKDSSEDVGVGAVQAVARVRFLPRRLQQVGIDSAEGTRVPIIVDEERSPVGRVFTVEDRNDLSPVEPSTIWERERARALRPVDSDDMDEDSPGEPRT